MLIVTTMCKIFLAMVVGFYCRRVGIFKEGGVESISSFLIRVAAPMYIVYSMSTADRSDMGTVLTLFVTGVCIYVGMIIVSRIIFTIWKVPDNTSCVYQLMLVFSNCALMGYPVAQAFLGDEAVFYLAILNLPYNILFYSYGIYMLAKSSGKKTKLDLKTIFSAPSLVCMGALVLYFTGIKLPEFVNESLGFVGSSMSSLSMVCIGGTMANYSVRETLKQRSLYGVAVMRLFLIPLIVYLVLSNVLDDMYIVHLSTLSVAMPTGAMIAMGAIEYGGNEEAASSGVALTTMLSIVTIPIVALAMGIA
ncbi:MAG: AEC family transporter [Lachnospiraceae bacterium]|nr:AEC family transporter [Lachnospiraceae bacterium]